MKVDPSIPWSRLEKVIADATGLHFPRSRWSDLQRRLTEAAQAIGAEGAAEMADRLLNGSMGKAAFQALAAHLTVGETYFWRDPNTLEALSGEVIPRLARSRRKAGKHLRIWSAGCCTGEEPYTLAILLRQVIPDISNWNITIIATDISAHFLGKANQGVYGKWSFRNVPAGFKEIYFKKRKDGRHEIIPDVKKMVTFEMLNLVDDASPPQLLAEGRMDLILCRNVLMYFSPDQIRRVVDRFYSALSDGGWLVVSPSETSQTLFSKFSPVNVSGATLYRKDAGARAPEEERPARIPVVEAPATAPATPPARIHEAPPRHADARECAMMARSLANQGRHPEALAWCDRWIAADKLDPAAHYLRAVVLTESRRPLEARQSLDRTVFLAPDFILAHFLLGVLARTEGRTRDAEKSFDNALVLLQRHAVEDVLPESEGMTAGRLAESIEALLKA